MTFPMTRLYTFFAELVQNLPFPPPASFSALFFPNKGWTDDDYILNVSCTLMAKKTHSLIIVFRNRFHSSYEIEEFQLYFKIN